MAKAKRLIEPKTPAFRSTGEVLALLGVPRHVLRFWESRFPLIRPLIGSAGKRLYACNDVELLMAIRTCLYRDAMTIRGAQKLIRDQGVEAMRAIGRGETVEVYEDPVQLALPAAADALPIEKRRALIAALSDPKACRALAQASIGLGF